MPTFLSDLFPEADFNDAVQNKLVRVQTHPDHPTLCIANYTEEAAYGRQWDPVTLQCRGLIYLSSTGRVLARPFPKFFNVGEPDARIPNSTYEPIEVTDKMDGSLGILFRNPFTGDCEVATRGSFASEQSVHATEVFRSRYRSFIPTGLITYLFEIVYPENRIVLNYDGMDDLVLLGAVDVETGMIWGPNSYPCTPWTGPRTESFSYATVEEALRAEPRENREGLVIRGTRTGSMVKVKQEDYIALHRIVTNLTELRVWEAIRDGVDLDAWKAGLPDEFVAWVNEVTHRLLEEHAVNIRAALRAYYHEVGELSSFETRKDFALAVQSCSYPHKGVLFSMADSKPFQEKLWDLVRPVSSGPGVTL